MRDFLYYEYGRRNLDQPLDHREVQKSADQAKEKFENLITGLVGK